GVLRAVSVRDHAPRGQESVAIERQVRPRGCEGDHRLRRPTMTRIITAFGLLVLVASSAHAQDSPLIASNAERAALRPDGSFLFWDAPNSKLVFEAQFAPRLIVKDSIGKATAEVLDSDKAVWGWNVSASPMVRLRMFRQTSAPVRTPSYMPKGVIQFARFKNLSTASRASERFRGPVSMWLIDIIPFGHHSNGQDGCMFTDRRRAVHQRRFGAAVRPDARHVRNASGPAEYFLVLRSRRGRTLAATHRQAPGRHSPGHRISRRPLSAEGLGRDGPVPALLPRSGLLQSGFRGKNPPNPVWLHVPSGQVPEFRASRDAIADAHESLPPRRLGRNPGGNRKNGVRSACGRDPLVVLVRIAGLEIRLELERAALHVPGPVGSLRGEQELQAGLIDPMRWSHTGFVQRKEREACGVGV